ncbi:MAG TPA: hypothetical protein VI479_03130 [Blastocatellia bacterium]
MTVFHGAGRANQYTGKMIACLKAALEMEGLITSDRVAPGTPPLSQAERAQFRQGYAELKDTLRRRIDPRWQTAGAPPTAAGLPQLATRASPLKQ